MYCNSTQASKHYRKVLLMCQILPWYLFLSEEQLPPPPHLGGCFFLPQVLVIVLALLWFWISINLWNANVYSHRLKETEPLRFPSAVSLPAGFCLRQVFQSLSSSGERSVYHTSSMKPTAPTERPPWFLAPGQTNAPWRSWKNGLQSGQWSVWGGTSGQQLTVESSYKGMKQICCANNKAR